MRLPHFVRASNENNNIAAGWAVVPNEQTHGEHLWFSLVQRLLIEWLCFQMYRVFLFVNSGPPDPRPKTNLIGIFDWFLGNLVVFMAYVSKLRP